MSETIKVLGWQSYDSYGNPVVEGGGWDIPDCVVGPRANTKVDDVDIYSADYIELEVNAPGGYDLDEGTLVEIRGIQYTIKYPSWDYNPGRKPLFSLHQPRTSFVVERSAG